MNMESIKKQFSIESPYDGLNISVLEMTPQTEPKAVVYVVHGLSGCKERFVPFMEFLTKNGIACIASDHRGHGDSVRAAEDRGYMYQGGVKAIVMDMEAVSSYTQDKYKNIPFIILGHSMGSLAIRAFVKRHDEHLDGMIVCGSPSPNPLAPVGKAIVRLICLINKGKCRPKALQKFTSVKYNKRFKKEGYQAWTCSDPQVRKKFAEDPRCNINLTADCSYTLLDLFDEAYSRKGWSLSNPELPILFLSGDDDPCMLSRSEFDKSVNRMSDIGYQNISCKTYPKMRHEILNEIDKETVWNDILRFVHKSLNQ